MYLLFGGSSFHSIFFLVYLFIAFHFFVCLKTIFENFRLLSNYVIILESLHNKLGLEINRIIEITISR